MRNGVSRLIDEALGEHPQTPSQAYFYAKDVLHGPFPAGEVAIAKDPQIAYLYAVDVLKAPFPAGEPAIATSGWYSYRYARDVLDGPFLAGEEAISRSALRDDYVDLIMPDLRPEL